MRIIFVDRSTKLETVTDLERRGRGGMVSSLFKVSDYLARRGHDVTVLSDIESTGATRAGAFWSHEFWGEYDCLIANRGVGDGYPDIRAKSRILWTHDLPHSGFIPEPRTIRAFACTVFMSRYAEQVWRAFYHDIGRSAFIPNGVDKTIFYPRQKDLGYLLYASAPNRGLKRLPFIFDCIRSRAKKPVRCRAYSNMNALHPGEVRDEGQDGFALTYKELQESAVDHQDPVPQDVLANEMGKAGLLLMPTDYPEICSNIVLQALVSGTPVITTGGLGATPEWVKHRRNGMLTDWKTEDYMVYQVDFIRKALEVLDNEGRHRQMIWRARRSKVLSWDEVGSRWERLIRRYS